MNSSSLTLEMLSWIRRLSSGHRETGSSSNSCGKSIHLGQGPPTDDTLVDTPSVVLPAVAPSEQIRNTDPCAPVRNLNAGVLDGETDVESLNANSITWPHPHSQESIIPRREPV